jgi:hypothetical protein
VVSKATIVGPVAQFGVSVIGTECGVYGQATGLPDDPDYIPQKDRRVAPLSGTGVCGSGNQGVYGSGNVGVYVEAAATKACTALGTKM